ncbi:glycerophosphoryl diester phosphodiesterase [Echria macrotheca]|uniref:Glycerophosphoryl diester phosphodiesterase n=1 Tax=Echria macrotheca TaxID=438768 RepID=A0AAJ0BA37_9PEZI|nr:glycerophosphoryl diester phosphodiesterase [Echria macrotheca]
MTEDQPLLGIARVVLATANQKKRMPQTIAHRGNKAAFPENSMAGFESAVALGVHGLETDIHLSRDGVVVLSHDPSLKRCFDVDQKIADCDWDYLSTLRTTREPPQPMPRLVDLLTYLAEPGLERIWLLLDIKTDDDPDALLSAVASTLESVPSGPIPWTERIVMGAWNDIFITKTTTHLPLYRIAYISFTPLYARRFLSRTNPKIHFNMLQKSLVGPLGSSFLRAVRKDPERRIWVWTVNDRVWMDWAIRKGVDGVITDDPALFLDVCRGRYLDTPQEDGKVDEEGVDEEGVEVVVKGRGKGEPKSKARMYMEALVLQAVILVLTVVFWRRLGRHGMKKGDAGRKKT